MTRVNKMITTMAILTTSVSLNAVQIEIIPTISKAFKTDGDSLKDNEVLYGVRGNLFFNKEVALQLGAEASTGNEMRDTGETDIERGLINLIYQKDIGSKFKPYTIVGGGYEKVHRLNSPKTNDDSQPFVNIGAGLKYDINSRVNLITEARWMRKLENDDDDIVATVGLGVKLGETREHKSIPSVAETTEAQNAISLAEFRKIQEPEKAVSSTVIAVEPVTTVVADSTFTADSIYVTEDSIPEDAIILGEYENLDDALVVNNVATLSDESLDLVGEIEETTGDSGYYVQLAALFKGRGTALTSRLERKNYHYILHNVQRYGKNASLVLVGPYSTKKEAKVALKYLKRLKSDAFIYHLN